MTPNNFGEKERPNLPSAHEIADAYSDILAHNGRYTGFGALFRAAITSALPNPDNPATFVITDKSGVIDKDPSEGNDLPAELSKQAIEGDMNAAVQDVIHGELFERIGLAMRPYGSSLQTSEGEASTRELVPFLNNAVLYEDFVASLKPEDIEAKSGLKALIAAVNKSLVDIIGLANNRTIAELAADTPINESLALASEHALRTYTQLEPQYERLGVDDSVLKSYVKYWGENVLPEYIKAESGQLLTPPTTQGFGPAYWHLDSGGYPGWEKAVQLVDLLASDDRTKVLSEEIRANLRESAKTALVGLSEMEAKDRYDHLKNAEPNLKNVLKALEGESYDAKQLSLFAPLSEHRTW